MSLVCDAAFGHPLRRTARTSNAGTPVNRRDLLKLGPLALAAAASRPASSQMVMLPGATPDQAAQSDQSDQPSTIGSDITLRIAPVTVELAPDRILSTTGYNGTSPGPVLRMKEGKPVTVNVINSTDTPEFRSEEHTSELQSL